MKAWLMLAAGDSRQHGGNAGYDDDPERRYVWDSTVPHHASPRRGDVIVLWDKVTLLGASVIESLDEADSVKTRFRCPKCSQTGFKRRTEMRPAFRCPDCLHEFDEPVEEMLKVHTYKTAHGAAWVNLEGVLSGSTLRELCQQPKSLHSLRELELQAFKRAILEVEPAAPLHILEYAATSIADGLTPTLARVRSGNRELRLDLLQRHGSRCAISGILPFSALDAARLCTYDGNGSHDELGTLLLRRDLSRLLDLGLVFVEPSSLELELHHGIRSTPAYEHLHGQRLLPDIPHRTRDWFRLHRMMHHTA
jgi:hypothetical protein